MADTFTLNNNMADGFDPSNPPKVAPAKPTGPPSPSPSPSARDIAHQSIFAAIESQHVAARTTAIANLNNYLNAPVGVAEHPDLVGEVNKLLAIIDNADSQLATLQRITTQQ